MMANRADVEKLDLLQSEDMFDSSLVRSSFFAFFLREWAK